MSENGAFIFDRWGVYAVGSLSVSLLEVEPDLAAVLSEEQRVEARRFVLPAAAVEKGGDIVGLFARSGCVRRNCARGDVDRGGADR